VRSVSGPTQRVAIVGAGLGGLACALHLAAAGREVTVFERAAAPGGLAGRLSLAGYEFDTGPSVLTAPELIAQPLAAVGERLEDWVSLTRLDPAYRAFFADGSSLDVTSDVERMEGEIARLCGAREARGYRQFVAFTSKLWSLQRDAFIARNFDSPLDLVGWPLLRLAWLGGFRSLSSKVGQFFHDPRTRRVFSFQALYAGVAPRQARAVYAVISYLDAVAGVYYPRGGIHAVPQALAAAATKHGVSIRYNTPVARVETAAGRATAVHTADGERISADAVVINSDLSLAYRELLPAAVRPRRAWRLRYSPSCVVIHIGSVQRHPAAAHHNLHFGRAWDQTFDDIITGHLMHDPSLLVTNPSRSDATLAPPGREVYYVLAPVPHLAAGGPRAADWRGELRERYVSELVATLEARGYTGFGSGIEVSHVVTPAEWEDGGHAAGTPFTLAHTFGQTGPFRPGNFHSGLSNVVFTGAATQPGVGVPMALVSGKLAAARVTG
jgi:phytoene desaturase